MEHEKRQLAGKLTPPLGTQNRSALASRSGVRIGTRPSGDALNRGSPVT